MALPATDLTSLGFVLAYVYYLTWNMLNAPVTRKRSHLQNIAHLRLDSSKKEVKVITPLRPVLVLNNSLEVNEGAVRLM